MLKLLFKFREQSMGLQNTSETYGSVAKTFHWLIFILIACLLTAGFIMTGLPNSPDKFWVYGVHKSLGITVLTLACLRLGWKAVNVAPRLPVNLHRLEKFLAHAGHAILYALMVGMPLSGWAMSSASGFTVSVFGWFTLPNLVAPDKELKHTLRDLHSTLAWALIIMVSLHVLAALLHHFYYKNNVLRRMLPCVKGQNDALALDKTNA
jgi:cytochrome b561